MSRYCRDVVALLSLLSLCCRTLVSFFTYNSCSTNCFLFISRCQSVVASAVFPSKCVPIRAKSYFETKFSCLRLTAFVE